MNDENYSKGKNHIISNIYSDELDLVKKTIQEGETIEELKAKLPSLLAEDIPKYVYVAAIHKRCAVCGKKAELHHCEGGRIQIGGNRNRVEHIGRPCLPLCRHCHTVLHNMSERDFLEKYLLEPVKVDERIAATYNLIFNASLMVEDGRGYLIGFSGLINENEESVLTFRPLAHTLYQQGYIIWKKDQTYTPAVNLYLDYLKKELAGQSD